MKNFKNYVRKGTSLGRIILYKSWGPQLVSAEVAIAPFAVKQPGLFSFKRAGFSKGQ